MFKLSGHLRGASRPAPFGAVWLVTGAFLAAWLAWLVPAAPAQAAPAGKAKPAAPAPAEPGPAAPPVQPAPAPVAPATAPAAAQQFKTLDVDPQQDTPAVQKAVAAILRSGTLSEDQKNQVKAYYERAAFPHWTQPVFYTSIPKYRADLVNALRNKPPAVHDFLADLTLNQMKDFIKPEYHPVVRYNAMFEIGELGGPEAQKVLLDELNNPQPTDLLLVAVLNGLKKDCVAGFSDEKVRDAQVLAPLLKLTQSPAVAGRSPESHAWLRHLAIEDLAALRQPGANGAVAQYLGLLVADDKAETVPIVRMAAARALGNLDYSAVNADSLNTLKVQLLSALVKMSDDVCKAERRRVTSALPTSSDRATGGGVRPPGGRGPGVGYGAGPKIGAIRDIDDPEIVHNYLRRLKTGLGAVQKGLFSARNARTAGVAGLFTGVEEEKAVRNMYNAVNDLLTKWLDEKAPSAPELLKTAPREGVLATMDKRIDEAINKLKEELSKIQGTAGAAPAPSGKQPSKT